MPQFQSMPQSSGDTGSSDVGVSLPDGSKAGVQANVTVGHSVLIILTALGLLWLLGGFTFRSLRMA